MTEIEKLYSLAGIEPQKQCYYWDCPYSTGDIALDLQKEKDCTNCNNPDKAVYPQFTAEKQIAIENIIFQCNFGVCELVRTMPSEFTKDNKFIKHYFSWSYHAGDIGYYNETVEEPYGDWDVEYSNPDRKEAVAGFVNGLWNEHLTEEERNEIRNILRKD